MTPLDVARSISTAQALALRTAAAGKPVLNHRAGRRLVARRLAVLVSGIDHIYQPTMRGREVLACLDKAAKS